MKGASKSSHKIISRAEHSWPNTSRKSDLRYVGGKRSSNGMVLMNLNKRD